MANFVAQIIKICHLARVKTIFVDFSRKCRIFLYFLALEIPLLNCDHPKVVAIKIDLQPTNLNT